MADIERVYIIPLRRAFLNVPKYKRAKKAASAVRIFIAKHMKSEEVKIGRYLNEKLWEHGIKNPPHHVKVIAKKDDKGKVTVELPTIPKKAEKKKIKEKLVKGKEGEKPAEQEKKTEEKKK